MGSFAAMGALAGAAQGWNEGSQAAEEQKRHSLDQEREERLATLKNNRLVAREETQRKHENTAATTESTRDVAAQDVKDRLTTSERLGEEKFKASESALERESREGIQTDKTTASGKSTAERKWKYSRTADSEVVNADGTITAKTGATTATNPYDHKTYQQKGDIWVLDGSDAEPEYPEEKAEAERILMKTPSERNLSLYMGIFGYLPIDALGASDRYTSKNRD